MLMVDSPGVSAAPFEADGSLGAAGGEGLKWLIFGLFFMFGGITSLNDVIIPKLKTLFTLSYGQAMLVQSAFFASYFVIGLPAAAIVQRLGYMRTAVVGLVTMMAGCLLFVPASSSAVFAAFLAALFVLAAGVTIVQVVANPLITRLGAAATAHSRLTFAQFFNSVGTTLFPIVGSTLILGSLAKIQPAGLSAASQALFRAGETGVIVRAYLALAAILALVALVVWTQRGRLVEPRVGVTNPLQAFTLLQNRRFALGALCIFLYVGAEVTIGSLIVNYLSQASVMGLSAESAGRRVSIYWGGAMVGRLLGAGLLRVMSPARLLAGVALVASLLLLAAAQIHGPMAGWALLSIGLCNSIMFPTIFALATEGLGPRTAEGSGVICVAIVGGAIVPPLTGVFADHSSLRTALIVPALCYLVIIAYGVFTARNQRTAVGDMIAAA